MIISLFTLIEGDIPKALVTAALEDCNFMFAKIISVLFLLAISKHSLNENTCDVPDVWLTCVTCYYN